MSQADKKTVFIFIDTDKHASPFDILTAIDLFPDAKILTYSHVAPEDAETIIRDAMFPRGIDGAKHTKLFIGGYDVDETNDILEVAKKTMQPPFELSVVIDPRGAYTTASAAVAKTLSILAEKDLGDFKDKTVTVLAGTGPVGRFASRLYVMEGANVIVTSRDRRKSRDVANEINKEIGSELVQGVQASSPHDVGEAIQDSHVVLSSGAAGIALLPLSALEEFGTNCKVVADINAIPPLGVEGLKADDEGVELLPGIWGIGALAIGMFKNRVEAEVFKRAAESAKGIFDYKVAYEIAKSMVLDKPQKSVEKADPAPEQKGRNLLPY